MNVCVCVCVRQDVGVCEQEEEKGKLCGGCVCARCGCVGVQECLTVRDGVNECICESVNV